MTDAAAESEYAKDLELNGYAFIPSRFYFTRVLQKRDTDELRSEYLQLEAEFGNLELDPYSRGNRYRKYAQLRIDPQSTDFEYGIFEPYQQTAKYNADTGGIVREYSLIGEKLQQNRMLAEILKSDINFVRAYSRLEGDPSEFMVGLHLFRYLAYRDDPAYSSPNWLHKDDENVVFVHLVGRSGNIVGGDNVIAPDAKRFETVLSLRDTFDTLVVNHDKLHAVTPVGTNSANAVVPARRDILLVTFQTRDA